MTGADLQTWIDWATRILSRHGDWALGVVLFGENLPGLSPALPGAAVLVVAASLSYRDLSALLRVAFIALAATILGDLAAYGLGRLAGDRLARSPRWNRRLARTAVILRSGSLLILGSHFPSHIRGLTPCAAGFLRLQFRRWLLLNSLGATAWVLVHVTLGYSLGAVGADSVTGVFGFVVGLGLVSVLLSCRVRATGPK